MKAKNILIAGIALATLPLSSWATLGGSEASVQADAKVLNATITIKNTDNYKIYELILPSTTKVKEYVSNNQVFAVKWKGPHNPNVQQILGTYFTRLQDKPAFADHASAKFIEPDFKADVRGSIHNHHGKAFLPQLLPANVTGGDIK